ncbi:MAG TPA: hypothetical protein VKZ75_11550 [Cyclobacteriaceae bacterium]|nr:hypothetical protein [Cyclobacteriaceae bacterium]
MKTPTYNPSPLEVNLADALYSLQKEIQQRLPDNEIVDMKCETSTENPLVRFHLVDNDGDPHEIIVRIIQIPDKF